MSHLRFQCRHRYASGFELDAQFEADGGVTALFGPSGGGKTTILGLLAGILRPQQASITLRDRVLVDTAQHIWVPPEQRQMGVVFQEHLLFPHMNVEQNLRYGLRRRPGRKLDFARVVQILELNDMLDRRPRTLSGGQRQRVALGRAILRGPELLLMDEPLAALDQALKHRILDYLERVLHEYQIPTILVSHDPADVRRLARQTVVVQAGRVTTQGPTDSVALSVE